MGKSYGGLQGSASLIGFYAEDHPQAYSLGLILRLDRHSQYDLWHPNPTDDAREFHGRSFLIVAGGDASAALAHAFTSVELARLVVYREHGRALARWWVFACRGFKGFDPAQLPGAEPGH